MNTGRREFLTGLAATSFAGCRLASIEAKPDLTFGVLSDVHLKTPGDEDTLLRAFEYFRNNGADAVLIAGDIADNGRVDQLVRCGDAWRKVFPGDKAPDGRHVEKLFIYGNHDYTGGTSENPASITHDHEAAWAKDFGEPISAPILIK